MNRVLKTFLLWLLIAALPVQGWTAAMKTSCSSAHQIISAADAVMPGPHAGATHAHHDVASEPLATDMDKSASASSHDHHKGSFKSSFCSVCALCCFGAIAPPSARIPTPVLDSSDALFIAPAPSVAGHVPPGLERPPRHTAT